MLRTSKLAAAFGLTLLSFSAHAVVISLAATPGDVAPNDIVTIDIVASEFGSGEFASAYDFTIEFDPLEFAFVEDSFRPGAALGAILNEDYFDDSDFSASSLGLLLPFLTSLLEDAELAALQTGPSVVLGTLELQAQRTTEALTASIGLGCNSVSGPFDAEGLAVLLDITACNGADVNITPIAAPEPGTLALLALGLLGLAGARRRHRRDCR